MSLWAAVPHYVAQPPCPKATLALLRRVEDLLDVPVPLGDLPEESRAWERGVDELAAEDEEVAEYVRTLEEARDTAELPEASGDAIAREFERYLSAGPARARTRASSGADSLLAVGYLLLMALTLRAVLRGVPRAEWVLLVLSLVWARVPVAHEGPTLIPLSHSNGLTVSDLPGVAGLVFALVLLWRERQAAPVATDAEAAQTGGSTDSASSASTPPSR